MSTIFPLFPIFLCTIACIFVFMIFLAIWLYRDSKNHGQNPILWVLICIFSSPILALILYLAIGRKQIVVPCACCNAPIAKNACYCEHCGAPNTQKDTPLPTSRHSGVFKGTVIAGILSLVGLIALFITMTFSVFSSLPSPGTPNGAQQISSIAISSEPFTVTSGWTTVNNESYKNGVWNFYMENSSSGYHTDSRFTLTEPESHTLVADIQCTGGPLIVELWQEDALIETCDLSDTEGTNTPLEISLADFKEGLVKIRIINHGATNIAGSVWIASDR